MTPQNVLEWDQIYQASTSAHKNQYPSEFVIRFVRRTYGNVADKSKIKGLDLGCGWGNNLYFLKDEGLDCYGLDFSAAAVEHLKPDFADKVCQGAAVDLRWDQCFFDFVIDRASIQHNSRPDISQILAEVHRVLKPGGRFFSVLLKLGPHDLFVTRLSEIELRAELSRFSSYEINYSSLTFNNGQDGHVSYVIEAVK